MKTNCRFCNNDLNHTFVDLGMTPLANSYIPKSNHHDKEIYFPLHAFICDKCYLVQIKDYARPDEIFTDYAYFSSFSSTWINHAKQYAESMKQKLQLNHDSFVVEIASNDGYLLQFFKENNIPHLGIEPARNVAKKAVDSGINTLTDFFCNDLAMRLADNLKKADLIVANNVLAHVPHLNDFVSGMKTLLNHQGMITIEFPHILSLMQNCEFDTIYHEHLCYFSLLTIEKILLKHELMVVDVDRLSTHGGSLRIYAKHADVAIVNLGKLDKVRELERAHGLESIDTYLDFSDKTLQVKIQLVQYLSQAKAQGKKIAAFGAPAKGNTLLNYCGIGKEIIEYTVDNNHEKQGRLLPGTHIPIFSPDKIKKSKPDVVLVLPWNISDEIANEIDYVRDWGAKIIVPIPYVKEI